MEGKRILLVEDDQTLGYVLQEYLKINKYEVIWESNGEKGLEVFRLQKFDLCILDIMMPKKDGFELAKDIKQYNPSIPFLFLTAKSLKVDKLKGFSLGADDYIVKPIDEEELLARIKAILRRSYIVKDEPRNATFKLGKFDFDYSKRSLILGQKIYTLTEKESELLKMLVVSKNNILDRADTLKKLWDQNDYFTRRSMDVHISHLRKVLRADPNLKIVNIHNKGFILKDG